MSGSAPRKGQVTRQVEILSNKLLATAFEASLEFMSVTAWAKRRQQGNRDSYWAPKYHNQSADFVAWEEGKTRVYRKGEISRGSAVSERTVHVTQGLHVNWGEPTFPLPRAGKVCDINQKKNRKRSVGSRRPK